MNVEQAKRLREPFPASAIGHLPKGGVMLEYVGHAATTDRLLAIDPEWSWEPFSLDESGLPALDGEGNLWIKLTICGVTRPGVGDGKTAKERIGDAIRNAAMRFGVALDLWAKEDLQANGNGAGEDLSIMERQKARIQAHAMAATESGAPSPAVAVSVTDPQGAPATLKPTTRQLKKLNTLVGTLRDGGHITTENLWSALAKARNVDVDAMIELLHGRDEDGVLHWAPLRDSLTRVEGSDFIDRLERLEGNVRAA